MCNQQSHRSACAYAQSDQSLCKSLEHSRIVKLLTEHHLEFLSLKGGCRGSSESTHVKMLHCWKSHVLAQIMFLLVNEYPPNPLDVATSNFAGAHITGMLMVLRNVLCDHVPKVNECIFL